MSITVKPVTPDFVAEISGLDLAQPLKPADRDAISSLPPVPQRVVRRHPGSGRKTLYVASHASHIIGMPMADGRLLLMDLIEHATERRFVHSHSWKQGDLVIWDNRCTMHRARPFNTTKMRDLRRVTTRDVASTVEQAA